MVLFTLILLCFSRSNKKNFFYQKLNKLSSEEYLNEIIEQKDTILLIEYLKIANTINYYQLDCNVRQIQNFISFFEKHKNSIKESAGIETYSEWAYMVFDPKPAGIAYWPIGENSYYILSDRDLEKLSKDDKNKCIFPVP